MKKTIAIGCIVFVAFGLFLMTSQKKSDRSVIYSGKVTGIYGLKNFIEVEGIKKTLHLQSIIDLGQKIIVGSNSGLEITFDALDQKGRTSTLRIYENSSIVINSTFVTPQKKFLANLIQGTVQMVSKKLLPEDSHQISTPNATVGVRGTQYYVQFFKNLVQTQLHVLKVDPKKKVTIGQVGKQAHEVSALETAIITKDEPPIIKPLDRSRLPRDPEYITDILDELKKELTGAATRRFTLYIKQPNGTVIKAHGPRSKMEVDEKKSQIIFKFQIDGFGYEDFQVSMENNYKEKKIIFQKKISSKVPYNYPIYYAFYDKQSVEVQMISHGVSSPMKDVEGKTKGRLFNLVLWEGATEKTDVVVQLKGAPLSKETPNKVSKGKSSCLLLSRKLKPYLDKAKSDQDADHKRHWNVIMRNIGGDVKASGLRYKEVARIRGCISQGWQELIMEAMLSSEARVKLCNHSYNHPALKSCFNVCQMTREDCQKALDTIEPFSHKLSFP